MRKFTGSISTSFELASGMANRKRDWMAVSMCMFYPPLDQDNKYNYKNYIIPLI